MCFSATASFGLGSALIISRVIQHRVQPLKIRDRGFVLSLFPLLFGIQQIVEGFVWLSIEYEMWEKWKDPSMYFFIFIAQVLWPIGVPFAFMKFEPNLKRNTLLKGFTIIGATTAVYLFFSLVFFPIEVNRQNHHLVYELKFQHIFPMNNGLFYFLPTVLPAFMGSSKKSYLFGFLVLLSFILSKLLFPNAFISIWCYFAAAISFSIYWLIRTKK